MQGLTAAVPDIVYDALLSPGLWLSVALALSYGAAIYGWRGGGAWELGRDLLAALVGFAAGQVTGVLLEVHWLQIGEVQIVMATLGSLLALLLRRFWGRERKGQSKQKPLYRNR